MIQKAVNKALENGDSTPNSKSILFSGDTGSIRNIGNKVILSSFSKKNLIYGKKIKHTGTSYY